MVLNHMVERIDHVLDRGGGAEVCLAACTFPVQIGCQQQPAPLFAQHVIEVQELGLITIAVGAVDGDGSAVAIQSDQGVRNREMRPRSRPPDMDEMSLAAPPRPMQDESPAGPVGPAIEPADRHLVGWTDDEVFSSERFAVRQVEGELPINH